MNHVTIDKETFLALKPGDVVLWNETCLRTVIEGARWDGGAIKLSKMRRSAYWRTTTVYSYTDIKTKIIATGKRVKTVISANERLRLKHLGFNVRQELVRELKEVRELKKRMGRALCDRKFQLPKLHESH